MIGHRGKGPGQDWLWSGGEENGFEWEQLWSGAKGSAPALDRWVGSMPGGFGHCRGCWVIAGLGSVIAG